MTDLSTYDVAIVGGGLAGLALSIQMSKLGHSVVLFEKEQYPFHKVCGEYISLESWDFIESLGLNLSSMQLPIIKKLLVSAPNGNQLEQALPLGGFGISRYMLDNVLKKIAVDKGVTVIENCKVNNVHFINDQFNIDTSAGDFQSKICVGSFGKRSNLDVKWKRPFTKQKPNKLNNYIGVKYHIKSNHANDLIALHNFKNGYCGISKIEADKYCLCYLTNAANLATHGSIKSMEEDVLYKNPFLKTIFTTSDFIYEEPLVISQISFSKKSQIQDHIFLLGDAAGMITPLCGNGMSMALHSSKIAAAIIDDFLKGKIARAKAEQDYVDQWQQQFQKRLRTGRLAQSMFGKESITNGFIATMKKFPAFTAALIRQTHGKPF